jgi:HlyD family secretion protein
MKEGDRMKKKLGLICILVLLSFAFSSCSIINRNKEENIFYGTVEADRINIASEIPGRIKEIKADEGQRVNKGDLVAVVDNSESKIKLDQAQIGVKNAQNEFEKVEEGNRDEEIRAQRALVSQAEALVKQGEAALNQANIGLKSAQTAYDYRKKIYDDVKELYEKGAETQFNLDNAKNQLDIAKYNLESAKNTVESSKAQLNSLKSQLEAARAKLALLTNGATERMKASAKYGVEQAEKSYELSKINLNKSNIISLYSGTIETVNFKVGEYVSPGSPIATLLDTNNLWVKIYVPEKTLPILKLNQEVKLKSEFLKDRTIKGKIVYISPEAEFTPVNTVTKKDRMKLVFEVKIKILDNLEAVKPGMLLDVYIE